MDSATSGIDLPDEPDSFERILQQIDDEQQHFQHNEQHALRQPFSDVFWSSGNGLLDSADIDLTAPFVDQHEDTNAGAMAHASYDSWQQMDAAPSATTSTFNSIVSGYQSLGHAPMNGFAVAYDPGQTFAATATTARVAKPTVINEKKRQCIDPGPMVGTVHHTPNAFGPTLPSRGYIQTEAPSAAKVHGQSYDQYSLSPQSLSDSTLPSPKREEDDCNPWQNEKSVHLQHSALSEDIGCSSTEPQLLILEQPVNRIRFRYGSERGAHGSSKYCPKVKVKNCMGSGYVTAKLYTCEPKPRVHVNKLWGGKECEIRNGTCIVALDEQMSSSFKNLGIMRVKEPDVAGIVFEALVTQHSTNGCNQLNDQQKVRLAELAELEAESMRECLSKVCIGFEAFVKSVDGLQIHLGPIFSTPIFNSHNTCFSNLKIAEVTHTSGSCLGKTRIWLRCAEKIKKDDIRVVFNEQSTGWAAEGLFSPADVFGQILIIFWTPPYRDTSITEEAPVQLFLQRNSDGERSNCVEFVYLPQEEFVPRKRQKYVTSADANFSSFQGNVSSLHPPSSTLAQTQTGTAASEFYAYRPGPSNQAARLPTLAHASDEHNIDPSEVLRRNTAVIPVRNRASSGYFSDRSSAVPDITAEFSNEQRDSGIYLTLSSRQDASIELLHNQLKTMSLFDLQAMDSAQLLQFARAVVDAQSLAIRSYCEDGSTATILKHLPLHLTLNYVDDGTGDSYLHAAARNKQPKALQCLLEALRVLPNELQKEIINAENHFQQTALHLAAIYKDMECLKLLVSNAADVSKKEREGSTVFHFLASLKVDKQEDISSLLDIMLDRCGQIASALNQKNNNGMTALHLSVQAGNKCVVEELLRSGASTEIQDRSSGKTALHFSIDHEELEIMRILLRTGADVSQRTFEGLTPLLLAVLKGNVAATKLLLAAGANCNETAVGTWLVGTSVEDQSEADESSGAVPCTAFDLARNNPALLQALLSSRGQTHGSSKSPADTEAADEALDTSTAKIDISLIDSVTRLKLCGILDGGLWMTLAKTLGYTDDVIQVIACVQDTSPTMLLLDHCEQASSSVEDITAALKHMNATQAADLIATTLGLVSKSLK